MNPSVAFIGLGAIGLPMATRIAERGFNLATWTRTTEKSEALAKATGSRAAASPADAVQGADVVITCLPTSREVTQLAFGDNGFADALKAGAILVDCTSGDPPASKATAARLKAKGVEFVDGPVSGGVAGAQAGTLTVMCGGDGSVLDRVRPVLESFAAKIVLCGPVGSGDAVKALSNALLAVHLWSTGEVLVALAKLGISPDVALEVINGSAGRSNSSQNLIPQRVLTREFPSTFRLALLDKDVRIAESVAAGAGISARFVQLARELFERAHAELGDEVDHTAALRVLEREAGVEIKPL